MVLATEMIISPTKKMVDLTKTGVLMTEMILSVAKKIVLAVELIFGVANTMVFVTQIIVAEANKMLSVAKKMIFVPPTCCARDSQCTVARVGLARTPEPVDRAPPFSGFFLGASPLASAMIGKARDEIRALFRVHRHDQRYLRSAKAAS